MPEHRRHFSPGASFTILTVIGLGLLVTLGTWQVQRLGWKAALIADAEARFAAPPVPISELPADASSDFRRVTLQGRYLHDRAFALGSVGRGGIPGAILVTPLELANGGIVLVERGWLQESELPPDVPEALRGRAPVDLVGTARALDERSAGPFTPDNRLEARRWFSLRPADVATWLGPAALPLVILREGEAAGEPPARPAVIDYPNNHLGYALTWYGIAAGVLAIYILYGFKRGERSDA